MKTFETIEVTAIAEGDMIELMRSAGEAIEGWAERGERVGVWIGDIIRSDGTLLRLVMTGVEVAADFGPPVKVLADD